MILEILISVGGILLLYLIQKFLVFLFYLGSKNAYRLFIICSKIPFFSGNHLLDGRWTVTWDTKEKTTHFTQKYDRISQAKLIMFGEFMYIRCTFKDSTKNCYNEYCFFGIVDQDYVKGHWYDVKHARGYFGVFQMKIIDENELSGCWLGHSKNSISSKINKGSLHFERID